MAFKPNYRRDRAERQRAARARTEEKQRKKEEKSALRKAEREAAKPRRMRSKRPGSLKVTGSVKHRHSCAENVSAIAFGVGRVNDLHPRAQCVHGRKLLDGKPSRERRLPNATACAGLMPASGLTLRPRSHR